MHERPRSALERPTRELDAASCRPPVRNSGSHEERGFATRIASEIKILRAFNSLDRSRERVPTNDTNYRKEIARPDCREPGETTFRFRAERHSNAKSVKNSNQPSEHCFARRRVRNPNVESHGELDNAGALSEVVSGKLNCLSNELRKMWAAVTKHSTVRVYICYIHQFPRILYSTVAASYPRSELAERRACT